MHVENWVDLVLSCIVLHVENWVDLVLSCIVLDVMDGHFDQFFKFIVSSKNKVLI